MNYKVWIALAILVSLACGQTVDCIKFINSTYATPSTCTSTYSQTRPINATAQVKILKNTSWYGADDWNPYLMRSRSLIVDLYLENSCYPAEPVKQTLYANKLYEFSVKCTMLRVELQKGDLIYFELFQRQSHTKQQLGFMIPIPGFSSEADIDFDQETKRNISQQALKMKRATNLAIERQ